MSDEETVKALTRLFSWIDEDYGPSVLPNVVSELLTLVRSEPQMGLEDAIDEVALHWSK